MNVFWPRWNFVLFDYRTSNKLLLYSPVNLGTVELSSLTEYFPQLLRVSVGRVL